MTSDEGHPGSGVGAAGSAMLHTVVALRWRRPRFAADLAGQVLDAAARRGDADTWLRAAGWMLHGRAAVGDAREAALEVLADMDVHAGPEPLHAAAAARLRVELAALAQANGDPDLARDLVEDWLPAPDGPAVEDPSGGAERTELELDRLAVLVRCALVEGVDDLTGLRADVEAVGGRVTAEAAGLVELLLGSVHRDDGEPAAAAARALRGLARLGWTPAEPSSAPTSPHLGCALLSQWVTAVLEAGTASDIPYGVNQLAVNDGGRHGVLWRLAVARAFAGRARPTADVLEDAAAAAAEVDAPSLEAACRSAQAELFEGAGRYQEALGAVRSAMAAERTDRDRARRLRDALSGAVASLETVQAPALVPSPPGRTSAAVAPPSPEPAEAPTTVNGHPADGHVGVAGSALATLDIDLGGFDVPAASVGTAGTAPAATVAVPPGPAVGVEDIPVAADATAATPLGDALLAELRATTRGDTASSAVESRDGADDAPPPASAPAVDLTIVLDLLDLSDGPLEHADVADVAADLVARAGRLVPPGSRVRSAADAPGEAVATISIPEAGEVVAALWARSLVGHVVGRVARRGLPDGAQVRARVVGPDGRSRGAATTAVLTGPSTIDPAGTAVERDRLSGGGTASAIPALRLVSGAEVRPGTGGRRRRPADDTDAAPAGVMSDGAGRGERNGVAVTGPGRHGGGGAGERRTPDTGGVGGVRDSGDDASTARAATTPPGTGRHTGGSTNGAVMIDAATNGSARVGSGRHEVGAGSSVPFVPAEDGSAGRRGRRRAQDATSGDSGRNGVQALLDGHARDGAAQPDGAVRSAGARPDDHGDGVGSADDGPSDPGMPDGAPSTGPVADPLDPAVPLTELGVAPVDAPPGATAAADVVADPAAQEPRPVDAGSAADAGQAVADGATRDEAAEPDGPVAQEPGPVGTSEDGEPTALSSSNEVATEERDRRARPARRSTRGRRSTGAPANGADPTAIPDDLGLGDLLAAALAAYRDI